MSLLSSDPAHRPRIAGADSDGSGLVVVVLCAAWCTTCAQFRTDLEGIAAERPHIGFVWLDVEDDAALCGDIEVENFPTVVAFRGDAVLHYGTAVPLRGVVARLVDELAGREHGLAEVPEAVRELRAALVDEADD